MQLIDSHSHLILDPFNNDRDDVIEQAFSNNITHLIQSCDNLDEIKENIKLTKKYKNIYSSVGIHPHEAKTWTDKSKEEIINYSKEEKVVAIGETGLDYYYNLSPKETQLFVFREQVKIAKEVNLPLIIHTRDAFDETFEILKDENPKKGVFHCFTGDVKAAKEALEIGFYISFSGIITFKNATPIKEAAKETPLDKILIETDSPFLAPIPHRGKRNEPKYVKHVAEEIARIKEISVEEVANITTRNAKKLFGII